MSSLIYQKVRANPRFEELATTRGRFAIRLMVVVLAAYYAFMMIIAFAPEVLRTPISEGATLTIGVPVGAAIIIGSWLLTGWFVIRSNGEFDQLNEQIVKEATK